MSFGKGDEAELESEESDTASDEQQPGAGAASPVVSEGVEGEQPHSPYSVGDSHELVHEGFALPEHSTPGAEPETPGMVSSYVPGQIVDALVGGKSPVAQPGKQAYSGKSYADFLPPPPPPPKVTKK